MTEGWGEVDVRRALQNAALAVLTAGLLSLGAFPMVAAAQEADAQDATPLDDAPSQRVRIEARRLEDGRTEFGGHNHHLPMPHRGARRTPLPAHHPTRRRPTTRTCTRTITEAAAENYRCEQGTFTTTHNGAVATRTCQPDND
ncbi:MAG: hypothetical protein OXE75_16420 [bacterium]|nr:hypothetical protein [bacterium]